MLKRWWSGVRPRAIGAIIWFLARLIGLTLRLRVLGWERVDAHLKQGRGVILVTWHGRTFIPANLFKNRGYWALISLSRDGEIQNHIFSRFGFQTIRGSTGRGGVRAALEAARRVKAGGVLAFTPDGPRGPSHRVQQGALVIAQKSGGAVFPIGVSAKPRKLMPTWDRYLIPYPFARGALLVGEPIVVPSDADDGLMEGIAGRIGEAITALECEAERVVGV